MSPKKKTIQGTSKAPVLRTRACWSGRRGAFHMQFPDLYQWKSHGSCFDMKECVHLQKHIIKWPVINVSAINAERKVPTRKVANSWRYRSSSATYILCPFQFAQCIMVSCSLLGGSRHPQFSFVVMNIWVRNVLTCLYATLPFRTVDCTESLFEGLFQRVEATNRLGVKT